MGILDDAGVSANEVPKDPFGFGNDYWEVALIEVNAPKQVNEEGEKVPSDFPHADVSSSGKTFGGMFVFRILDERFQFLGSNNPNQMPGQLGFGQWTQLPAPAWAVARGVEFDKNSPDGKKIIHGWATLLKAFGIPIDQMGKADVPDILGKTCLAKVYAKEDENGFWQFRVAGFKEGRKAGSPQGIGEFTQSGTSNPVSSTSTLSAMEKAMLEAETSEA